MEIGEYVVKSKKGNLQNSSYSIMHLKRVCVCYEQKTKQNKNLKDCPPNHSHIEKWNGDFIPCCIVE